MVAKELTTMIENLIAKMDGQKYGAGFFQSLLL